MVYSPFVELIVWMCCHMSRARALCNRPEYAGLVSHKAATRLSCTMGTFYWHGEHDNASPNEPLPKQAWLEPSDQRLEICIPLNICASAN